MVFADWQYKDCTGLFNVSLHFVTFAVSSCSQTLVFTHSIYMVFPSRVCLTDHQCIPCFSTPVSDSVYTAKGELFLFHCLCSTLCFCHLTSMSAETCNVEVQYLHTEYHVAWSEMATSREIWGRLNEGGPCRRFELAITCAYMVISIDPSWATVWLWVTCNALMMSHAVKRQTDTSWAINISVLPKSNLWTSREVKPAWFHIQRDSSHAPRERKT